MPYEEPTFNRAVDTVLKDAEFEKRLLAIGWGNAQGARTPARVAERARWQNGAPTGDQGVKTSFADE
ncbi:MAG: hypothetical protein A3G80_10235 [Betaproteobacteria bacterium RIFCSPLOWO2_12_FULL_62_13b]|nr:MAG: hypothetical protein A3G80_10235 [Betaproteobacteria bacterium RIFCSPLOWO2_12_FULL_62_13b]